MNYVDPHRRILSDAMFLTRKCFTIAIKTIQLSSHITKHDEFIKAIFSSEIFFETNNILAIRGNLSFKKLFGITFLLNP